MLQLKGEIRTDYFNLECTKCSVPVKLTNPRWVGGVPQVVATCSKCGEHADMKLHPPTWIDVIPLSA
jgi:hypothetical protein